jgi:hypothetical protein
LTDLIKISDHVEQAQDRLVEQFKPKPTVNDLIEVYTLGLQTIEDELIRLLNERTLESAVGQQLDNLGAIVGQPREGRTDEEYRLWISARRLIANSNGTPDDHLRLIKTVLPASTSLYIPFYPAGYQIRSYGLGEGNGAQLEQILWTIKPAGVAFGYHYSDADVSTLFTLGDAVIVQDPLQGLGDTANPSTGGGLTSVFTG